MPLLFWDPWILCLGRWTVMMPLAPELDATIRMAIMTAFVFTIVLALVYLERKILGHIQQRLGPMRTGFHGILQSPADAVKLLVKEDLTPASADHWVFQLAPYLVFVPIFMMFVTIPFRGELVVRNLDLGIFYLMALSSLHIVGMLMAGWGSDNKYALLQPLGLVIFLIASLAETTRTPFDIPVAEAEVVGGPLVEYSGMRWAIFFLGEYASLFATSAIAA